MTVTMLQDRRDTITPDWHAAAVAAAEHGVNVLPALGKRPTASSGYKHLFRQRLTAATLRKWLSDPLVSRPSTGYLIMLGEVSGNLCCRDFDEEKGYEIWKKRYPELARTCPTVKTARGYHVYFRCEELKKTTQLDDGELRAANALVVGPCSKHESGLIYAYIPNSPMIWDSPTLSPAVFEVFEPPSAMPLKPHQSPQVQSVHENRPMTRLDGILDELDEEPGQIFIPQGLIPTKKGERNKKIMELVRWIRSQHPTILIEGAEHFFERWYQLSFSAIGTKERWLSEREFRQSFTRCTGGKLGAAAAVASLADTPAARISTLCRELAAQSATGVFFLSVRAAADAAGCQRTHAHRILKNMTAVGKLKIIERGTQGTRFGGRATTYQFTA